MEPDQSEATLTVLATRRCSRNPARCFSHLAPTFSARSAGTNMRSGRGTAAAEETTACDAHRNAEQESAFAQIRADLIGRLDPVTTPFGPKPLVCEILEKLQPWMFTSVIYF